VQRWDQAAIQGYKGRGRKRKRKCQTLQGGHYERYGQDLADSNNHPQLDSGDVGDGDTTRDRERSPLEVNGKVKDVRNESMRDADLSAASPQRLLSPIEFPDLPDDLASFENVLETEVRPGAIIAFRQLDMSKATNWQPLISDYRTGVVDEVLDDCVIRFRLADRDKNVSNHNHDNDNPRQYSKFEMPGYDEEEEDDGFREIAFEELIDPKLLRPIQPAPPAIPTEEVEETQNAGLLV
jgi:hypothetical protein